MGRSSSKPLQKPHNPLQEMQYKELQRERNRLQQQREKKQIVRLQQKQARKQRKTNKRKRRLSRSQAKDQHAAKPSGQSQRATSASDLERYDFRREDFKRQLETKVQTQLNEDLCEFLLNQMTLSIQFFKNYESELSTMADEMLNTEKLLNRNLEEHTVLLTNPLDVAVSKWIRYKPLHGPDKQNAQLLQAQTVYVVFENVDIARPNDANYDSISPLCKVDIELDFRETTPHKDEYVQLLDDIKWKGYVRLRLQDVTSQSKTQREDFEDVCSETSSGYGTTSPYTSKTLLYRPTNSAEPDYDYAFISHLNTQHPLRELKMTSARAERGRDAKVLPESCITSLGSFVRPFQVEEFTDDEEASESECEENESCERGESCRDYDTLQALKLYKIELERRRKLLSQNYLNSREFMKYFGELVWKNLATKLNVTETELNQATYRGTSIHTSRYELIPAIYAAQNVSDWPKCAFEFRLRDRPFSTNPQTGQRMQWPTRAMIKRIETFGFHVIPLGYASKKKHNPFRDIEWRIVFPKAERYLEQHLTNAQVKVFMMAKALIKCFVEPHLNNRALTFALDHLRMHLFWECESNYAAWPEEFLGEVLLRFINSFKQRVKEKHLSDFFIRERNLFENIPEYSLNTLHTILADITANPLMHVMTALRNLEFGVAFFPKLNFKKLYENLVENDLGKLKMLAKNARSLTDWEQECESGTCVMHDEGAKGLVGLRQHHVRTNGKLRRKTHLLRHNLERKKQAVEAKRPSVESIDLEFFFKRNIKSSNAYAVNQGVENLRRTNILEIVLDHLLGMTAAAIEFGNVIAAKIYLRQARSLCKCYHNYGCDLGAKEYLASIHSLDEELQIIYDKTDFSMEAPLLPRRISVERILPEASQNFPNLYDEMAGQRPQTKNDVKPLIGKENPGEEVVTTSRKTFPLQPPEPTKSIKFNALIVGGKTEDTSFGQPLPQEGWDTKTCLKSSNIKSKSPEPKKSLKFRNEIKTVTEGELDPIQKPQGNSPVSISRSNHCNAEVQEAKKPTGDNSTHSVKHSLVPSGLANKLKCLSARTNPELLQNIAQNTNQLLNHVTAEEKKAQIREMLKRKTLQIQGAFNQSSDS